MLDLKPYFDAVNTAKAEVQRVAGEIDALFSLGTDESKAQALGLRPALDEAQAKAEEANHLYESLKSANMSGDVAVNFVPVSQTPSSPEVEKPKGVMKRTDWNALSPNERAAFVTGGGVLED